LGGGLRLVLPPLQDEADPVQIELKIESFLRDSSKLYLEVHSAWPRQSIPGGNIAPIDLLNYTDTFINDHVVPFLGAQNE